MFCFHQLILFFSVSPSFVITISTCVHTYIFSHQFLLWFSQVDFAILGLGTGVYMWLHKTSVTSWAFIWLVITIFLSSMHSFHVNALGFIFYGPMQYNIMNCEKKKVEHIELQ